jgi:hypothetical protein
MEKQTSLLKEEEEVKELYNLYELYDELKKQIKNTDKCAIQKCKKQGTREVFIVGKYNKNAYLAVYLCEEHYNKLKSIHLQKNPKDLYSKYNILTIYLDEWKEFLKVV